MNADQVTFMPPVGSTETLYSVCAALHHLRGGMDWEKAGLYYFKDAMASWHRQMPCNLDHFCKTTRNLLGSPEKILEERTLAGFYVRFINPRESCDLIAQAKLPRPKFRKSADPDAKKLRLCLECVAEDRKTLGRGTWRLEHQLPGARVCIHHGRDLQQMLAHNFEAFRRWMRPEDFVGNNPMLKSFELTSSRASWGSLAKILWILKSHHRASPPLLRHILAQKLAAINVLKAPRFLSSKAAEYWLNNGPYGDSRYSPFLKSDLRPLQGNWLKFLDGRGADHPLRWAAVLATCMSSEDLNLELDNASPLQATISGCWEISGQIYENLLPKHIWDALLEGVDIREVSDRWRIRPSGLNRALRLNPELKAIREMKIGNDILRPRREWIRRTIEENPGVSRANLFRRDSASLRWLELNDRVWYRQNVNSPNYESSLQKSLFPNLSS